MNQSPGPGTMTSSKYTRVQVHLRKASQSSYKLAKFSDCILDYLGLSDDGYVECCLEDNRLLLQPPSVNSSGDAVKTSMENCSNPTLYKIMHPPFCPVHHLDEESIGSLSPEISNRGVDVGVAIILESDDRQLLLTRRAAHMRTFPGVWVPPGGHVEDGETLEAAALRELEEETGLVISEAERKNSYILGLWESVFPPILAMGEPKRHHIVVYLHITLARPAKDLIPNFKLCPEEVDAAVWLSHPMVRVTVWNFGKEDEEKQPTQSDNSENEDIHITLVNQAGEHVSGTLDSSILRNRILTPGSNVERISTGSRFALSLWLEKQTSDDTGRDAHKDLYKSYVQSEKSKSSKIVKETLPELKNKM